MITFTEAASSYITTMLAKENKPVFRLSIKKTGCSGYSYKPELLDEINKNDTIVTLSNQTIIYLDTAWLHLLENLKIDFIEEVKSGLKQKRLVFENPKEASRCGCGESFHVAASEES